MKFNNKPTSEKPSDLQTSHYKKVLQVTVTPLYSKQTLQIDDGYPGQWVVTRAKRIKNNGSQ